MNGSIDRSIDDEKALGIYMWFVGIELIKAHRIMIEG